MQPRRFILQALGPEYGHRESLHMWVVWCPLIRLNSDDKKRSLDYAALWAASLGMTE